MTVHIYIDETGTVSNAQVKEDYGFGWLILDAPEVAKVTQALKTHSLDKIHLRELNNTEKEGVASRVSLAGLEATGLIGGALIRKDPDFAANIVDRQVNAVAIENPKWLIAQDKKSKLSKKKIVRPSELIQERVKEMKSRVRLQEITLMATRYPLVAALKKYGLVDIHIHFSEVASADFHGTAVGKIKGIILTGLNALLDEMNRGGILNLPKGGIPRDIDIEIEAKADDVFGLSDLFAYVGRCILSNDPKKQQLGASMYAHLANLFQPSMFGNPPEVRPGVFIRA